MIILAIQVLEYEVIWSGKTEIGFSGTPYFGIFFKKAILSFYFPFQFFLFWAFLDPLSKIVRHSQFLKNSSKIHLISVIPATIP